MPFELNPFQQPIGLIVEKWEPPPFPPRRTLSGRYCRLETLDADRHAASLFAANSLDQDGTNWTYLAYGPFEKFEQYLDWVVQQCAKTDPQFYAIVDLGTKQAIGVASYLRIEPATGSIEVGHIHYSPKLKRTVGATEAMYLLMANAFELGYRRYEWKCNALNWPSRAAAQRLGFTFEGVFRQATIVKGRNRDTAWYSIIDSEWPAIRDAFLEWLSPANFDVNGQQRVRLSELTLPKQKQP